MLTKKIWREKLHPGKTHIRRLNKYYYYNLSVSCGDYETEQQIFLVTEQKRPKLIRRLMIFDIQNTHNGAENKKICN